MYLEAAAEWMVSSAYRCVLLLMYLLAGTTDVCLRCRGTLDKVAALRLLIDATEPVAQTGSTTPEQQSKATTERVSPRRRTGKDRPETESLPRRTRPKFTPEPEGERHLEIGIANCEFA